jgi:DNA-binding MarR family transcriptional regulator
MVKKLDEKNTELLDHAGWRLWRLAREWKVEFEAAMVMRGHAWFGEARAALIGHLDREGTPQSLLAQRLNMTKQAVQQFVDDLAVDGVVERHENARDRRSKIVRFTRKGLRTLADANEVKQAIELRYAAVLGARRFAEFMATLEKLSASASSRKD